MEHAFLLIIHRRIRKRLNLLEDSILKTMTMTMKPDRRKKYVHKSHAWYNLVFKYTTNAILVFIQFFNMVNR